MVTTKPDSKTQGNSPSVSESAANDLALLKRNQLARALNASSRSVDNWQRQKKIPYIKISPRCVRFYLPAVLAALRKFEVKEVS
jgi:hypothetical protein